MSTIHGVNLLNVSTGATAPTATPATTPAAGSTASATATGVGSSAANSKGGSSAITSQSTQLQAIQSSLQIGAPIDFLKVDALKQAINSGTYTPDPSQIANGLISSATGFLSN